MNRALLLIFDLLKAAKSFKQFAQPIVRNLLLVLNPFIEKKEPLSEATIETVKSGWKKLRPQAIRYFVEAVRQFECPELSFPKEELISLAKDFEKYGKFNEMLGFVEQFELAPEEFDWTSDINKLLKKPNTHPMIFKIIKNYAPELQRETINKMATN